MDKKIPIYFDSVIVASPMTPIASNSNIGRLNVGVFTKYGNRNGSYITDQVAEQLIASATKGLTPVVGFFDPDSQSWSGHTGPTLASAYGYVEGFVGWQPFTDTDGEEREYAVFSVVLFTDYFNEANFVVGQNQSMELNIDSIEGDWADINGYEYFVYTKAEILGLCVIGAHEPCFSVSHFFEKKQDEYNTQYAKFSSLLADIKARVEEANKNPEGGERQMEQNEILDKDQLEQDSTVIEEEKPAEETEEKAPEVAEEEKKEEETPAEEDQPQDEETPADDEPAAEEKKEEEVDETTAAFEAATAKIVELESTIESLKAELATAQEQVSEFSQQVEALRGENETLNNSIAEYAAEREAREDERKNNLVNRYQNDVDEEEINSIREHLKDFSYEQLESKLAICYSNKHLAGSENPDKVALPDSTVNEFALLMEKYRRN